MAILQKLMLRLKNYKFDFISIFRSKTTSFYAYITYIYSVFTCFWNIFWVPKVQYYYFSSIRRKASHK